MLGTIKYIKQDNSEEKNEEIANPWGNPETAKEIIESIPLRIKKDKVGSTNLVFHFDLEGETGGQFSVKIKEGNCTVHPEFIETPDCIITALASVYEDVELGRLGPEIAIMSGKMKISNLGAMMGFVKLFHRITNS
jgi:putative sterol carrier protein